MSASLVGSEMCIRDRPSEVRGPRSPNLGASPWGVFAERVLTGQLVGGKQATNSKPPAART
eukprot:13509800-Alexandrium_andersonii.AAC.1